MKKFFLSFLVFASLTWLAFSAIMPGAFKGSECNNFHPHVEEFGGAQNVSRIFEWLISGSMKMNAWTNGAKTIAQFVFNGKTGIIIYGTGNPTMFIPARGVEYVREQTSGANWKQITSEKGLNQVRTDLGCHKRAFEATVMEPAPAPVSIPLPKDNFAPIVLLGGACLGIFALFLGAKAFAR